MFSLDFYNILMRFSITEQRFDCFIHLQQVDLFSKYVQLKMVIVEDLISDFKFKFDLIFCENLFAYGKAEKINLGFHIVGG